MNEPVTTVTQAITFLDFLKNNWEGIVAVTALTLSSLDLFLHFREFRKERANIEITQELDDSFYLSFTYYDEYHCAIVRMSIDNKSSSDITLSKFILKTKDYGEYEASIYNGTDEYNLDGISLYTDEFFDTYHTFDIKSENLLSNNRIEGYGNIQGYLYFEFPKQIFTKPVEIATLHISTPRKIFTKELKIPKIPETLRPRHPVEEQ